jgi:hypothetical protein
VFGKRLQFAAARRVGALPLTLVLLLGGFGAPLVTSTRFAELEENSPVKNRVEELSHGHRITTQRQNADASGLATVSPDLSPRSLGHAQHPIFSALGGHRLPNGLLAPITC